MKADKIPGFTRTLGAPREWAADGRDKDCGALAILDGKNEMGAKMTSQWKPDKYEIEAMAAGAPIYLTVYGAVHPPVSIHVGFPPEKDDEKN